jgi:chemotaxis-related protein WspB
MMLFFLFRLGDDRYALEARRIAEILPLVAVKRIPRAPASVVGVIDYHGTPVPLIDLSQLALDRPALWRLGTRIILVNYPDQDGVSHLLGLLAEWATETMRRDPADFVASGIGNDAAPYLGPVAADATGLIQWIEVEKLLPPSVRDQLFKQAAAV